MVTFDLKVEKTNRRTDDDSWWRSFFGENFIGHFWGHPIWVLLEDVEYEEVVVPKGFTFDFFTLPGPLKIFLYATRKYKPAALFHDWLTYQAMFTGDPEEFFYADWFFWKLLHRMGAPEWMQELFLFGVRLNSKLKDK